MKLNADLLILIVGIIVYSIFYVLASFGYKLFIKENYSFKTVFLLSLFFAVVGYCIKIPLFYYYGEDDVITIYILYTAILAFAVALFSKLVLHSKIHMHTYVILVVMVLLVIVNQYLTQAKL